MNKIRLVLLPAIFGIFGCGRDTRPVISIVFVDSLIRNYQDPVIVRSNDSAMVFWKKRINPRLPGITSESKYAGTLSMRFHFLGDIGDIESADSVLRKLDSDFNHKEAQANLTLAHYAILRHRFKEADAFLESAKRAGIKKYDLLSSSFDVDFELGRYFSASNELKEMKSEADYGYFFRRSKMDHLNGLLDSAIRAMTKAAEIEDSNPYLEQAAMSNAADLYIHAGESGAAAGLYKKCIRLNSADIHSIMGLGWIALVHDHNDTLAEKIFAFARTKSKLPDPLYKLTQVAQARGDSMLERKYAHAFASEVSNTRYGNMYNKYLVELYTGILKNPSLAEKISSDELNNRATPQTYAWYAWSLFSNNKKQEAFEIYQKNISGRPLEGVELYWMGKLMQGMDKGYNARAFYKAAYINKYDLSPEILRDLEKQLD